MGPRMVGGHLHHLHRSDDVGNEQVESRKDPQGYPRPPPSLLSTTLVGKGSEHAPLDVSVLHSVL